jgi:hypothetical protein
MEIPMRQLKVTLGQFFNMEMSPGSKAGREGQATKRADYSLLKMNQVIGLKISHIIKIFCLF